MPDFSAGYQRIKSNPENVQRDIFSTMLSRGADFSDYPSTYFAAKNENFDPAGAWRGDANAATDEAATEFVGPAKQTLREAGGMLNPAPGLWDKTKDNFNQFLNSVPDPLAFRTPVVAPGQGIESGDVMNQRAIDFVRNFKPQILDAGPAGSLSTYASPFGTTTQVVKMPSEIQDAFVHRIAFQGPAEGYDSPGEMRRSADILERMGYTDKAAYIKQELEGIQKDPLRSPAQRYTLGTALENIPTGDTVSATPIGGQKGARNRLYSSLTNQALAADSFGISSVRTGPETWTNTLGNTVDFNPSTLKDPLIQSVYNLPKTADVSQLRDDPLGLFKSTNVDFSRPVITTDSPVYQFRKNVGPGALGGIAGGAALSALSPDVAQSVAQGKYGQAATQTVQNMATGAAADTGVRLAGLGLRQVAPQIAAKLNPLVGAAGEIAVPAAVGAGLFMQGQKGSPLNTLVNAASNTPIGLKVNPKTDVGRMAGNELQYALGQLLGGKIPYMGR